MPGIITVRVVPGKVGERMDAGARAAKRSLTSVITEVVTLAVSEIQPRTPVGWSGVARSSWQHEVRRALTASPKGVVTNAAAHLPFVEEGRRPGKMPPVEALIPWVGSKLGVPPERRPAVAFLVARKIGRTGTPGAHMIEEGWEKTHRRIRPMLRAAGVDIVREIRR